MSSEKRDSRECRCGCGKVIADPRPNRFYYADACRKRAMRRRANTLDATQVAYLKKLAEAGVPASFLLKSVRLTVAEIARRTGVSYTLAWLVANGKSGKGSRSEQVREMIDEAIGFDYPWQEET